MNEASLKVLRMVADGKLSAEQADELLAVLDDEHEEHPPTSAPDMAEPLASGTDQPSAVKSVGDDTAWQARKETV
ncbi:MAG: hypothetical protein H0X37_01295 [Herpetosiphonaceae bacterium]|nr:hypothetical protein [Herpetosiphonaceae bacterium]